MTGPAVEKNSVAIVIPTRNAGQHLAELLDSLKNQTVKLAQILVIDSESCDKTLDIAKSHNCKVITINRADFDNGTTRNLAVAQTDS